LSLHECEGQNHPPGCIAIAIANNSFASSGVFLVGQQGFPLADVVFYCFTKIDTLAGYRIFIPLVKRDSNE